MNLVRFGQSEWDEIKDRLASGEGGFRSKGDLAAWIALNIERLEERYGVDGWSLSDALTMGAGGPKEIRRGTSKRVKRAIERAKIGDSEKDEKEGLGIPIDLENVKQEIAARGQVYLGRYEVETPNDEAMIGALAAGDVRMRLLSELILAESMQDTPSADRIARLESSLNSIIASSARIQDALGITKKKRDELKEEASDFERVVAERDAAAEFVRAQSIELKHKCGENMGRLITAFREFKWEIKVEKCPLCGERDVVWRHEPNEEDLMANEPDWVMEEESKYRHVYHSREE